MIKSSLQLPDCSTKPILHFIRTLILLLTIHQSHSYQPFDYNNVFPQQGRQLIPSSEWPTFKPIPIFSTDSLEQCSSFQNSNTLPFKILGVEYVALSIKSCGLTIFNIQDPKSPIVELRSILTTGEGSVNQFQIDYLRNLLWITHSSGGLYTIDLLNKPFSSKLAINTNQKRIPYIINFIPNVQDIFLVVCYSEIQVFALSESGRQLKNGWYDLSLYSYYNTIELSNSNSNMKVQFTSKLDMMFVGSQGQGLLIYETQSISSKDLDLKLIYTIKPHWSNLSWFQLLENQNRMFIQMQYGGIFEFDMQLCLQQKDLPSCSSIQLKNQNFISTKTGQFYINKDETFLFTQYRAKGAIIMDISQGTIIMFQTIEILGEVQSLTLNEDETLMFYSSTFNFFIFQKSQNEIDYSKPNILLNIIQSYEITKYKDDTNSIGADPCCFFDEKRNFIYLCRQQFGFAIFEQKAPGIVKLINQLDLNVAGQFISDFQFFEDNTIAYIPKNNNGLTIMDFTNPSQPITIKEQIKFGVSYALFSSIQCTNDLKYCCIPSQYTGLIFIDVTIIRNPQLITIFVPPSIDISLSYSWYSFMKSKNVLVATVSQFGLVVIDFTDPQKVQQLSTLFTDEAGESIITSDDKYCLVATYIRLLIIDIQNLNQLLLVSSVKLFGDCIKVRFIHNEQYAIVTSYENPGMFLIDISDKYNPILSQTYKSQLPQDGYFQVCLNGIEDEGFLSSIQGLKLINIKNQIILHTEIYELLQQEGTNKLKYNSVSLQQPLYVGQTISLYVIPLYEELDISVKSAQLYQDYVLQPLKSWMTFSEENFLLNLNILNDALQQDSNGEYIETTQTIIFQVHKTLQSDCFSSDYLSITDQMSLLILKQCQLLGYIDETLMAAVDFNPQIQLDINLTGIFDQGTLQDTEIQSDIFRYIMYVIQHSIIQYPIQFKVAQSLTFQQDTPNEDFIFSLQSQITIYISTKIPGIKGFVDKNYLGVLCVVSQQQDEIKIDGDIQKVNQVLKQKIKFSSQQTNGNNLVFVVQVDDGINHQIVQEVSYQNALFISEQEIIKVNDNYSLQADFEQQVSQGGLYINQRFQYQISPYLIIGEQNTEFEFTVKMKDYEGIYRDIPLNHWLQFSQTDKVFSGQPSQNDLYSIISLQVNVTDNYSFVIQELTINVDRIPLIYILQIAIQVIGPLIGLIGIWKYKFYLINFLNKRQYTYSKEIIFVGQNYTKQILLNNINITKAKQFLIYFKELVPNKEITRQIYQLYSLKKSIKCENFKHFEVDLNNSIFLQKDITASINQNYNYENIHVNKSVSNLYSNSDKTYFQQYYKKQINNDITKQDEVLETDQQLKQTENIESYTIQKFSDQLKFYNSDILQIKKEKEQINTNPLIFRREEHSQIQEQVSQPNEQISQPNAQLSQSKEQVLLPVEQISFPTEQISMPTEYISARNEINFIKAGKIILKKVKSQISQNQLTSSLKQTEDITPKSKQLSLFQRSISKKMDFQIQKINKFQMNDVSDQQSQPCKQKDKQTINKQIQLDLKLFNDEGEVQYDKIIEYIVKQYSQRGVKEATKISQNSINKIQNKYNLIRLTLQSYIAEYILQQDQFSYHLFKQLFRKEFYPERTPDWYKSYCIIQPKIQEIQQNPLPDIQFKNSEIIQSIKDTLFNLEMNSIDNFSLDKFPISLPLLQDTIKAYALGFISSNSSINTNSQGESIKIRKNNIKQITSFSKRKTKEKQVNKKGIFDYVKIQGNYIPKPLIDNSKLPSWIKSVDIINKNLLLIGLPEKKDAGSYHIFIFRDKNYILRQFEIQVVNGQEQLYSNNLQNIIQVQDQLEYLNISIKSSLTEEKKPHINEFIN